MKKLNVLLLLFLFVTTARAQAIFSSQQEFNSFLPEIPLSGLDMVRKNNPEIIRQINSAPGAQDWTNDFKYTTVPASFGNNLYTETGTYTYDSVSDQWVFNNVMRYDIDFDAQHNQVRSAVNQTLTNSVAFNPSYRIQFTFNTSNQVDSQYVINTTNGNETVMSEWKYSYDMPGRVIRTDLSRFFQGATYLYRNYYQYDASGRMSSTSSLLSKAAGQPFDSSTKTTYVYDAAGRLTMSLTEAYQLQGSPYKWTVSQRTSIDYNTAGQVQYAIYSSFDVSMNYRELPIFEQLHTYDSNGNLTEFTEKYYNDSLVEDGEKTVLFYPAGNYAETGFGYAWTGNTFSSAPDRKYIFNRTVTGIGNEIGISKSAPSCYPNPAQGKLYFSELSDGKTVAIYNLDGQLVKVKQVTPGDHAIAVDDLIPGMYVAIQEGWKPARFLKQ